MTPDEYFAGLEPPIREIAAALREILREQSFGFKEEMKWKVPTYSLNRNICSIMAHKTHVNFQIFQGAHIEDAAELQGAGKDMRHVGISNLEQIDSAKLIKYLAQAVRLDG